MTSTTMVATNRPSLDTAHQQTGQWIQDRLGRLQSELAEAKAALKIAQERKWATEAPARLVRSLTKHYDFLVKVKAGIDAGYAIVLWFNPRVLEW